MEKQDDVDPSAPSRETDMVKSDLVDTLAKSYPNLPKQDINLIVSTILERIVHALGNKQRVEIRGFGSFSLQYRAPRTARNPSSGASVQVPGRYSPSFRAGKNLRVAVQLKPQNTATKDPV